jgi:hypothetical protein
MRPWLVRGGAMGVAYAIAETLLAANQVTHPGAGSVLDPVVLAGLVGVGALWGGLDGWFRRENRGMNWFYAGLIGGLSAGLLSVIARAVFVDQTGVADLWPALTGDAAFIALLIMLPGAIGVAVGGRLDRGGVRRTKPAPARHRPVRRPG